MHVRNTVETIFEDGKTRKHALGIWSRPFRKMSGEAIVLMLGLVAWLPAQLISGAVFSVQDAVDAAQVQR